ncbi:Adenylate and Guanylate cyclase catalytic domain containing protein [Tritrichomonas foetus]|uniref:Adenylate and Guanylate cyclase catalytic domain containing protein n=1 Tax=Tritrichomonas foetus TaxID=1144522 RepID=A0A1J4L277_9EUKA|nr:Adenylate and Guanylate cyclase catalytic domain containing protein [Tritrichomonas foetus]|eukprot:OHT17184.1 Adenylate and Guanylate cyclase catalytic domain containing protein [Tritrichomonas foetus]
MYHCLSSDSLYNYYILSLKRLYSTFPVLNIPFNLSSFDLLESWHMAIGHVYAHYLDPLMGEITDSVQHVLTNSRSDMITVLTVLLVLSIFIALFYAYQLFENEQELKSTLLLLLHAPPNEILESSYIMAIISGDFSSREESGSQVDEAVFKSITDNYPDALITFTNSGAIITKNEKAQQLLEGPEIKNDGNENNSTQPGTNQEHNDENNHNNNNIISNTTTAFVKNVPNEIVLGQTEFVLNGRTISASYSKIDSSKMLVMLNDLSRIQELGRQLEEETKRKASLISKLMPSILTPKVMSKTSNGVSFSVQSVTITMISLGLSGHDDNVFDVFNKVYQSLNSIVKHYHTIESVEIVGDVFMVVGGLFDEVNQAERHAREIIKFALEAIEKISSIKQKYCLNNEPTLCGVATGGPVSGGVIELDIPIFEVCGDVVDLADAMMIQGVPNIVHTTRSVYELIYGRDFQIKERGELTIPNFGTVVTYLVSSNTNQ